MDSAKAPMGTASNTGRKGNEQLSDKADRNRNTEYTIDTPKMMMVLLPALISSRLRPENSSVSGRQYLGRVHAAPDGLPAVKTG